MKYIQRHSLLTRVVHGVAAITCILLAVTGVFVFVPSLGGGLMGGDFTHMMRDCDPLHPRAALRNSRLSEGLRSPFP